MKNHIFIHWPTKFVSSTQSSSFSGSEDHEQSEYLKVKLTKY